MERELFVALAKTRLIELDDELDSKAEKFIREALLTLDELSHSNITILMNSEGGCTVLALQLVDLISTLHSPVTGVVQMANSAASALLQGCNRRLAYSSAIIKLHSVRPSETVYSQFQVSEFQAEKDMDEHYKSFKKSFLHYKKEHLKLYVRSTGRSKDEVQSWFERGNNTNYLFSAKEAVKCNLVDEVVKRDFRLLA